MRPAGECTTQSGSEGGNKWRGQLGQYGGGPASTRGEAVRAAAFAGRGHGAGRAAKTVQNGLDIAAKRGANNPKKEDAAATSDRKHAGTSSQPASATRLPTRENHAGTG